MLERAARTNALLVQCDDLLEGKRFFIYFGGQPYCSSMLLRLFNYLINNHQSEYDADIIGYWVSRNFSALLKIDALYRPVDPSCEKMKKILPHGRDLISRMG